MRHKPMVASYLTRNYDQVSSFHALLARVMKLHTAQAQLTNED